MPKKTVIKVEKLNFKELLSKTKVRSEEEPVELHSSGDTEKSKNHKRYRTPRDEIINSRGMEYNRPLAGDPARDIKYQELAREFVNNGLNPARAYAAVFGATLAKSADPASKIFNSSWMKSKVREILLGVGEGYEDLPKAYLIERLMQMIDSNVLDYFANDGTLLSVAEIKALPAWTQTVIKTFDVSTTTRLIAVKDENGVIIKDDAGRPHFVEVKDQRVRIELYDKLKAMDILAKAMKWITSNVEVNVGMLTPDIMMRANARIKQLRRDAIEGTAKRIAAD